MSSHVRTALISTAGHCKVACGFCFRADRAHGFLDTPTYTRTLSRLKETGVDGVCLTGGEPTHHPQLRQLVRLAHQFGMSVSMVTSARTMTDVIRLSHVADLLANVTVSADSRGAMLLGRTTRTAASGIDTLRAISTETKILHVTCWNLSDSECRALAGLVTEAGVEVQFSPVVLDENALRRDDMPVQEYLARQWLDAEVLGHYFDLSDRYRGYLDELRDLQLPAEGERRPCCSATAYVSADGRIRRCPYGQASVSVLAPRAAIGQFLTDPAQDRVTPDCAAICRPSATPDDREAPCSVPA
ncbi:MULTISPECIES: radical SAM protein [Streptomyces]|uniref:Radical SAM protein n=1 Tax=Streptomyces tsukubensis (strain DSM 42081 / NBRC 108919 / NRRL 18488 / 9993) TaxID=1114943 RepID=I2N1M5_STRT9|nr:MULTISPECIES: radical SAM protein [Streptomyces]AZK95062.1 radical SAM protein [Streptomyces tsukubensis]EIF90922.1 radical SAM domain-containing protein [Streptomyces tsukubensis NRRL18488]MYS63215.1 radical SAM protein [Streptomyces sp. SID5473]QKM68871.1 radical SAM protein [Streptomyces tsukubensis NRRL18488]TAI43676.1 radical SAM protein [Streptomyces tsukubensis]